MENKVTTIGVFGHGFVSRALLDLINQKSLPVKVKRICVKNTTQDRSEIADIVTFDPNDIYNDPDIQLIIELTDAHEAAFEILRKSMESGKDVISANKKMIAAFLPEIHKIEQQTGRYLLYEASCCGSIPIIRTLDQYFQNEDISQIEGVFNGSSNYVLTQMGLSGQSYEKAVADARMKGFAESNPENDMDGFDACAKLCIMSYHAWGQVTDPENVLRFGISALKPEDIRFAEMNNCKIKLLPRAVFVNGTLNLMVIPAFVPPNDALYHVDNEFNAVVTRSKFSGSQFYQGKGAGGHPTALAVAGDISLWLQGFRYRKFDNINVIANSIDQQEHLLYLRAENEDELRPFFELKVIPAAHQSDMSYLIVQADIEHLKHFAAYIREHKIFIADMGKLVQPLN